MVESDTESPEKDKKGGPKSVYSHKTGKTKALSGLVKKFKEFKPKAEPLTHEGQILKSHRHEHHEDPDLHKYDITDVDHEIDKLRIKVENEHKRRKIEEELKKKRRRLNRLNAAGVVNPAIGKGPYTTDSEGHVLPVKQVNAKKLVGGNFQTVHSKINDINTSIEKIKGLEHLYAIPAGIDVKYKLPTLAPKDDEKDENKHVQEITALQV